MLEEKVIKTILFADYFQFYIQDDDIKKGDLSDSWNDKAIRNLIATAPFTVGIGTVRNTDVPVTIHLTQKAEEIDFEKYDLINRCSLEIETGRIVFSGCTDYFPEALRIEVPKGFYEIIIGYGNLDLLSEDGLDGGDFYDVFIRPTNKTFKVQTLKDNRNK